MAQVLSLAFRPKKFDELVGQDGLIKKLRGHHASGRMPQAWMFVGESGSGKTTIARIMALSMQCRHSESFGNPCDKCLRNAHKFDITEINAGDITGIDPLRNTLQGSDLTPSPGSRKRIYIIDEAQGLSPAAQTLLLKYFEDCPQSTVFFVSTTDPAKVKKALRRRCIPYNLSSLDMDGIKLLVKKSLKFVESDLASVDLVEALWSSSITSAGYVLNAVEKYVAGATAEEAARVEISTDFNTSNLCHAITKGDLEQCMSQLQTATSEDCRAIRSNIANYLKAIVLNEIEVSDRTSIVVDCIGDFNVHIYEDGQQLPTTVAAVYKACKRFSKYKH